MSKTLRGPGALCCAPHSFQRIASRQAESKSGKQSSWCAGLTKVGERDFYDVLYSNVPKLRELEMRMIAQQEEYSKSVALSCIVQLVGM